MRPACRTGLGESRNDRFTGKAAPRSGTAITPAHGDTNQICRDRLPALAGENRMAMIHVLNE